MLAELGAEPVIMETHGGLGQVYRACYDRYPRGVVFEKDPRKTDTLSRQRPTWAVYEADCVKAIAGGAGAHLPVNFVDVDPYGDPWPAIDAFLASDRPRPDRLCLAVNDGLRHRLVIKQGWVTGSLDAMVAKYGNDALHEYYLEICREMLADKVAQAGYRLSRWAGYYCGAGKAMTHYGAVLEK